MFIQTLYLYLTYSCNGCNFELFIISVSNMNAQFQGCWHQKELVEDPSMAIINNMKKNLIINSNEKKILFIILKMICVFRNENFSL